MNLKERQFLTICLSVDGIGRAAFGKIKAGLAKLNIAAEDFWRRPEHLLSELHLTPRQQTNLLALAKKYSLTDYWELLCHQQIQVVLDQDANYPVLLAQIPDRPLLLFVKGQLQSQAVLPIAVVGSRRMTSYGEMVTKKIVRELVELDATIISGLMYGVDSLAHQTAQAAGGYSIGVLGYGFDYAYPSSHRQFLADFLAQGGCIVTELAPHIQPVPHNFPMRNRIVAGLSLGVLVTEAALQSGSHITAGLAGEYGREVFAVPGSITNIYSEGTKWLINQGAMFVSQGQEIIDCLQPQATPQLVIKTDNHQKPSAGKLSVLETEIYQLLQAESSSVDDLVFKLKRPVTEIITAISALEIQGLAQSAGDVWLAK